MLRVFAAAAISMFVTQALAEDSNDPPVVTGRSVVTCDRVAPVCGIMGKDRLVPFNNACDAQQAGALRVLEGQCYDDD